MATSKPRYTVSVDDKLFEEIENFRFDNRYDNRAEATVAILKIGMERIKSMSEKELADAIKNTKGK